MSKKYNSYTVMSDVKSLNFELDGATLNVIADDRENFGIRWTGGKVTATDDGGNVTIKQHKTFFGGRTQFDICIPGFLVPNSYLNGKDVDVNLQGGIHGAITLNLNNAKLYAEHAAFEQIFINGTNIKMGMHELTVKNQLVINAENSEVVIDRSFATFADVKIKNGNIGFVAVNSKKSILGVENGNLHATFIGSANDYAVTAKAVGGTCNCKNSAPENASKEVFAHSVNGNVVLDFTESSAKVK